MDSLAVDRGGMLSISERESGEPAKLPSGSNASSGIDRICCRYL